MRCNNHTCSSSGQQEATIACGLCRDAVYCSRKCQAMDWVAHDCPNALHTSDAIFVPYHFEDTLPLETVETLEPRDSIHQAYSLKSVLPNMTIETRHQPALIQTATEAETTRQADRVMRGTGYVDPGTFSIEIESEETVNKLEGAMPRDLIFAENKLNSKAQELGGGRIQATETNRWVQQQSIASSSSSPMVTFVDTRDSLIFWPHISSPLDMPLEGTLAIKLTTSNGVYKEIRGAYDFLHETVARSDVVQKNLHSQLEMRLGKPLPKDAEVRCVQCTDSEGNRAVISALLGDESTARVIDVEFVAPAATLKEQGPAAPMEAHATYAFDCDPSDVNQLVGLAMGLQLFPEHPRLRELSKTISAYAERQMSDAPADYLSPHIASAVGEANELLHDEFVEARERWGTNPFKGASKYVRRLKSSRQVVRAAKAIKLDKTLSQQQKEDKLQVMYDGRLDLAEKQQAQNMPGTDFIDQADQILSIALEDTPERKNFLTRKVTPASPAIALNAHSDRVRALREREMSILDQRARTKDQDAEYTSYQKKQRGVERKEYRKSLEAN